MIRRICGQWSLVRPKFIRLLWNFFRRRRSGSVLIIPNPDMVITTGGIVYHIGAVIFALVFIATGIACNVGAPMHSDSAQQPPAAAALLDDSVAAAGTGDMKWAKLALEVPGGFAGIYLDDDGKPVLLLTHPEQKDAAIAALANRQLVYLPPGTELRDATVKRARWDFAQLYDWSQYLRNDRSPSLGADMGASTFDIDEVHNRLAITVAPAGLKAAKASLRKLSLPRGLVSVEPASPICLDTTASVPATRVWVKDSQTQESITPGARLRIRSPGFDETVVGPPDLPEIPLEAGVEKTGTFDLTVSQTGYHNWEKKNVSVAFDGCHPVTVELTALLSR
jgi:hypothetical protein